MILPVGLAALRESCAYWPPGEWDAGEVLFAGLCMPGCMLAMDTVAEQCVCRCEGRFHAVLIGAKIPADLWPPVEVS